MEIPDCHARVQALFAVDDASGKCRQTVAAKDVTHVSHVTNNAALFKQVMLMVVHSCPVLVSDKQQPASQPAS